MNSKKVGIIFIVIGILAISSFLIYPILNEKTEVAVPVLKSFSDSSISGNGNTENTAFDNSEIWENDNNPTTEMSLPFEDTKSEAVSAVVFPIDINTATVEELMQIKNVGRVIAENIVSYRENYGYFYSVDDLINVDRIGAKRLDDIRAYVCIREELLPETNVTTAVTSSVSDITVPTSFLSSSAKQTSVKTTVNAAETEDTDNVKINDNSFSDSETESEEYYPDFPLDLNTASAKDLTYINGIGDTIAERIVEYAQCYGFYDVNELLNVKGIGQSKLNRILPYVYVDTSGLPPKT